MGKITIKIEGVEPIKKEKSNLPYILAIIFTIVFGLSTFILSGDAARAVAFLFK